MAERNRYRQRTRYQCKEKVSIGVACCRFNNGRPEILLACKRITYALNVIAHGKYNPNSNAELIALFSGTTVDEKHDILSLNHINIWYRVWLNSMQRTSSYFFAKNKFDSTFVADNGARLRRLISKATHANRVWEIPKGRKKNKNEPDIQCAIREFFEETGVSKSRYKLFPGETRSFSYIDAGVRYTNIYYLAFTKHKFEPKVDFSQSEQVYEISDLRWMNIDDIRRHDDSRRLERFIRPIFNFMKKHAKD